MQTLQELDVSYNKLQWLPAEVGRLSHLVCLRASYNQLAEISPEVRGNSYPTKPLNHCRLYPHLHSHLCNLQVFAGLSCLESLHLNDNELSQLPLSIGSFLSLSELCLQYNKIEHLPPDLGQLPALRHLELEGNPLRPVQLLHLASESAAASSSGLDLERFRQLLMLQREADHHSSTSGGSRPLSALPGSMALRSPAAGSTAARSSRTGAGAGIAAEAASERKSNGVGDRAPPLRADASKAAPDILFLGHNGAGQPFQVKACLITDYLAVHSLPFLGNLCHQAYLKLYPAPALSSSVCIH